MHNPKKKPSRGVCGVCGRPVVAISRDSRGSFMSFETGHTYKNGKLVSVRCPDHYDGLTVNTRALNAAPTEDDLRLLAAIRKRA